MRIHTLVPRLLFTACYCRLEELGYAIWGPKTISLTDGHALSSAEFILVVDSVPVAATKAIQDLLKRMHNQW